VYRCSTASWLSRSSGTSGNSGSTVLRRGALEDPDGLMVPWRHGTFNVPATEPALVTNFERDLRPAFIPVDFSMQGSFPGSVALQVRRVTRNAGIKGQLAYWMRRRTHSRRRSEVLFLCATSHILRLQQSTLPRKSGSALAI
jgi:hypothetical protein